MPLNKIPTKHLTRTEWEELRDSFSLSGKIGGSDMGTILGYNPYKSRVELFYQCVGFIPRRRIDNESMFHGRNQEDYVASLYQYWDGDKERMMENFANKKKVNSVRRVNAIIENPKYPFLFANIDRVISKHYEQVGKGILEVKTMSGYFADAYESGIPPQYIVQLQHYMLVCGYKYGVLAALVDGNKYDPVLFNASPLMHERIIEMGEDFYNRVQVGKSYMNEIKDQDELIQALSEVAPEPDISNACEKFYTELHKKRLIAKEVPATDEWKGLAKDYRQAHALMTEAEGRKQELSLAIKNKMLEGGINVVNFGPAGKISWNKTFTCNVNIERLENEVNF